MSARKRKQSNLALTRRILGEVWRHPNNRDHRIGAVLRALWWQARKRTSSKPIERQVFGSLRMMVHTTSDAGSNIVYFGDKFDHVEMTFLERYLRPGDVVLDVGANIGSYTLLAAKLVGPTGSVHSFEPVPRLVEKLRENVALNALEDVVEVHEVAVSNAEGVARFRDIDVSSRLSVAADDPSGANEIEVRTARLDSALGSRCGAVLGKIDVEGAELMAFEGMAGMLAAAVPPVWLLEVLPNQLERQGATKEALLQLLDRSGYDLATYDVEREALEGIDAADAHGNVLAIARSHAAGVAERLGAVVPDVP